MCKNKRGRWVATFSLHGNKIRLGTFKTKEEAVKDRVEAEKKYYSDDDEN